MRLVSWNCRSGFHRKLDSLATLAPDVAIVSECANLEILASKARLAADQRAVGRHEPSKSPQHSSGGAVRTDRATAHPCA